MSPDEAGSGEPAEGNEAAPEASSPAPRIVGIGASAGGIEALRLLFPRVEQGSGMAFVVVQHLDPDHPSILPELLARCTTLPVEAVENETVVEADHVYVIPPNTSLTIKHRRLRPERPTAPRGQRNPIDEFLISLANDQGENAACVILSGTGSDGTLGLRAIKEHGGVILAQASAEYDGMMRSAVSTGLVDFILPAGEIAGKLADYFGRITRAQERRPESAPPPADHLARIATILREQTGHDFTNYKDRTVVRRIQRRMHVLQIEDMEEFVKRLTQDSREVSLLFQDLLIGVTTFFRDPAAFAALERTAVPELFKGKGPTDTIRVWVPGCATGEEAYSIAMLLRDGAPDPHRAPKLQIFASDIDEQALIIARTGRYPATISTDVPAQRLARYFVREDGTYRVISEIREACLFSSHNLLRDAPFSKLNLISCRNLLIYLRAELQDRLIPLFHYALAPEGILFLGTSENVSRHSRLFGTIDKTRRIFRRRTPSERHIPEFPLFAPDLPRRGSRTRPRPRGIPEPNIKDAAERQLLDRFLPAYAVVNTDGDVLQISGHTGDFLELPAGAPDTNIFNMARLGLRVELRSAFHRASSSNEATVRQKVSLPRNGGRQEIDLFVQPLRFEAATEPLYMVIFQERGELLPNSEPLDHANQDANEATLRQLEMELHDTRGRLQVTTEELESSNEELKSGNEELQSINEELQSANEELETSKEELQSINEELQTVNAELSSRVEELSRANNDMSNLLESTQIATVFVDRELHVKRFTPAAKDVFRLVESDAGRPIMHIRSRLNSDTIQEEAERVLRTLATIERPVSSIDSDTRYMMRMLPYRTTDNVISGVVMTFTDITRISMAEARIEELTRDLRARIGELETILDLVPVGVIIIEKSRPQEVLTNDCAARLLGAEDQHKGLKPISTPFRLFQGSTEVDPEQQPLARAGQGETVSGWQGELHTQHGSVPVMISASPLRGENGVIRGAVAAVVDITQHKEAEAQQHFLMSELQHRVKNILATVSSLASRMLRDGGSVADFRDAFLARLGAMGRTHDLLSNGGWSGAALSAIAERALAPYATAGSGNIRLDGPGIKITANAGSTLGMVFHELATNASKYGALSNAGGQVDVFWRVQADGTDERLELTWVEQGGPRPDASPRSGFGTTFITRGIEYELSGSASLELAPEGLRCTISFPLAGNVVSAS